MNYKGSRRFTRTLIRETREEIRLLTPGAKNRTVNDLLKTAESSLLKMAKFSAREMERKGIA